jgi:hypothetical protein
MVMQRILNVFFPDQLLSAPPGVEPAESSMQDVVICATNDEVSMDLARAWCDEDGLRLQIADHRDRLFPVSIAGMVIDLNNLALRPAERARFVERLAKKTLLYPVAVASYDLEPEIKEALKGRGILVFRRIGRRLFSELANAMKYNGTARRTSFLPQRHSRGPSAVALVT